MTVIGEPGIGKSRLARELAARLGGRATVLEGRCLPYGPGITYWPVREMVLQAARGTAARGAHRGPARRRGRRGLGRRHARPGRGALPARRRPGASGACSPPWRVTRPWCSSSRTSTGPSRRCSTSWTTSPRGSPTRRCCCSASPVPSCSPPARRGRPTAVRLGPLSADESRRLLAGRRGLSEPQRTAVAERGRRQPAVPRAARGARGRARRRAASPARPARSAGRPARPARPAGAIAARRRGDRG